MYKTIKEIVLAHFQRIDTPLDPEALAREVMTHFPTSKWDNTHWNYYRYQFGKGKLQHLLTDEQRARLYPTEKLPSTVREAGQAASNVSRRHQPEDEVKRIGDHVLSHIRFILDEACGDDARLRFKVNRWVFSRLLIDERKAKKPIKEHLWTQGDKRCAGCGTAFESIKGVELHRVDRQHVYSIENCTLLCRPCHAKIKD